jgi:lipopolysaccharide biosynthesis glycosyltransferase
LSDPLRIVIGFDRKEVAAYHTLCNSILNLSSKPLQFTPLYLPTLEADNLMWREREERQSTDFSFSRFLSPHLVDYKGKVLFLDCDMIIRGDISELFGYLDSSHAIAVCKHDFTPTSDTKFGGLATQSAYPRKLWSAVMLFNCSNQQVKNLTPKVVNMASGKYLHQFEWLRHESWIGEIPEEWHFIPGHSDKRIDINYAKLIHYTEQAPWWPNYPDKGSEAEKIWLNEHANIVCKEVLK